jgi:hypothetical protein
MKIAQLINGIDIAVTNEEQKFINKHEGAVRLTALDEHENWIAQNLVRKGVYSLSKDNTTLNKNIHELNS